MITFIAIIALLPALLLLADYVRHDRFGGPRNSRVTYDDLGPIDAREHLVPRGR